MIKFGIGAVTFRSISAGKYVSLMGDERQQTLWKFYRHQDLGDLEPFVFGYGPITHDDVAWATMRGTDEQRG